MEQRKRGPDGSLFLYVTPAEEPGITDISFLCLRFAFRESLCFIVPGENGWQENNALSFDKLADISKI